MASVETRPALSILLVEDNEINYKVAEAFLTRAGHRVTASFDGVAAIEAAGSWDFDIILMDIQMPDMDGVEATRRIRALPHPRRAGVPILALTANCAQEDVHRYLAAGMNGVIEKPLRRASIDLALAPFLPRASNSAAGPAPMPGDTDLIDARRLALLADAIEAPKLAELYDLARRSIIETADALTQEWCCRGSGDPARIAHRLAGVAANFGCIAVAADIEADCRTGSDGRGQAARLKEIVSATLAAMPTGP